MSYLTNGLIFFFTYQQLQQNVNDQHNSSSNTYSDVHRVAPEQNQNSSEKIMHQSKSNQSSLEEKLNETAHSLAMKTAQWELVKAEMETLIMRKVERENELNLELTNIKKQLNESSLHSKTLECNIAELQTAYYNTSVEKDRYIEMISNLEQQLHDATSKFEFTEDQQVDLINRNIELVQQNDEFSKQLLESKNNNKEMTDQLSKVNSEFVAFKLSTQAEIELSDNIKLLEPQIVQLELTIHRKQKEIETIASSLRETKDEFEVQKSKAYSFSESTQAEIDSLQHKISEQIKTIRSLEDKIQQLTSSKDLLDNSKNELNHKTEEIKSKDSKIIQLSSTINALHIQIDANENDFKRLADEKETYTKLSITKDAEIKSMNLRLDAMKKTLQDKIKEISSVSDERSSLLSTKISLDEKIYCLQSQIKYFTDNFVDRTELNNLKEEFSIYEETKKGEIAELIKKLLQSEERLKNKCSSEELKLEEKKESKLLNICPPEVSFRCICGLFNDEGAKIQCSKCMVLQHMACVGTDGNGEYLCEVCDKRPVDLEIPLKKKSDEGYAYYLTLLRGDMQIRQFDTVYILRDVQVSANATEKHTYKSIGKIDYTECDIFRIEQLWKDPDGNRFVYGHHYLRPQETYHERYRKFYKNEIVRVPLYEVLPIDLIVARCWVLDPTTFSIGRPVNCEEEHVYICELRVDKNAKIFTKIRRKNPVCTEPFAFKSFGEKLKISRDFSVSCLLHFRFFFSDFIKSETVYVNSCCCPFIFCNQYNN